MVDPCVPDPLQEVLHDDSALGYLIQYLEARDAAQLVRFWLDVSSYQASAATVGGMNCPC